jgi:hypothetical protein
VYFVVEEAPAGIHQEFSVACRTKHGFAALPFDRNTVMEPTGLHWHHGAVTFDRWLPRDRMRVTISGDLDSRETFKCRFVLALKQKLRVVSYRIIQPTE